MKMTLNLPDPFLLVYKDRALKELVDSTLALQLCNYQENSFGKNTEKQSGRGTSSPPKD